MKTIKFLQYEMHKIIDINEQYLKMMSNIIDSFYNVDVVGVMKSLSQNTPRKIL